MVTQQSSQLFPTISEISMSTKMVIFIIIYDRWLNNNAFFLTVMMLMRVFHHNVNCDILLYLFKDIEHNTWLILLNSFKLYCITIGNPVFCHEFLFCHYYYCSLTQWVHLTSYDDRDMFSVWIIVYWFH